MPKAGFTSVTIPETVYAKLAAIAKQQNNTVPRIIENLVNYYNKHEKGSR